LRKVEKDPKGASTPDKEQWPRYEARKKLISPRVFGDQKTRFDEADRVKRCFKPIVELKFVA